MPTGMREKLPYALAAYAVIGLLAGRLLTGQFRLGIWVLMAALAVKSWLAYKQDIPKE
jgi:hypothetical protein